MTERPAWWRSGIVLPRGRERFAASIDWSLKYPLASVLLAASIPLLGFASVSTLTAQFFPVLTVIKCTSGLKCRGAPVLRQPWSLFASSMRISVQNLSSDGLIGLSAKSARLLLQPAFQQAQCTRLGGRHGAHARRKPDQRANTPSTENLIVSTLKHRSSFWVLIRVHP